MIADKDFAERWNKAGVDCTADLIGILFREIHTQEDVGKHNLMLDFVLKRIDQSQLPRFYKSLAELVEQYSREALQKGR
jgi:hypothetical protein